MQPSECQRTTFTREQFYEKLWSMPTTKVAKELGCSDVMVGKICKEYGIPKPYLGYWAKLQHGKKPKKTPLPKDNDPNKQTLTFHLYPGRETEVGDGPSEPEYDEDIRQLLDKARAMGPVVVPTSLHRPHPLVAATRERIKADRMPYDPRTFVPHEDRQPALSIDVSKALTTRALCILEALIKRVEALGGHIEVRKGKGDPWRRQTIVYFGGEQVTSLRVREKKNQVRVPADPSRFYSRPGTELHPSGLLMIDDGPSSLNRILLRDTPKGRRIEDGLGDFIIDLIRQAGDIRLRRRKDEEERRRREEQERIRREQEEELRRRREELAARQKAEQAQVDELVEHASSWRQSKLVRDYLGAICQVLLERDGAIAIDGDTADYLRWAHQQADRLDPLRPSPPSVLDEHL